MTRSDGSAVLGRLLLDLQPALRRCAGRQPVDLSEQMRQRLGKHDLRGAPPRVAADALCALAGSDGSRRALVVDLASMLARRLAPESEPPCGAAAADAWQRLLVVVDRLHGSGFEVMGRLPLLTDTLYALLLEEARRQLSRSSQPDRRVIGGPGPVLARMAASRKLQAAAEAAFGFPVAPALRALYAYDPPGSHVPTHVDSRDYELVVHLILEHEPPGDGAPGSALVTHAVGGATRIWLRPGEAVALRGRGTVHSWQRLRSDEHRTLLDIGFIRAPLRSERSARPEPTKQYRIAQTRLPALAAPPPAH